MEKFNRIRISDNVPKTGTTYYYFHACMSTHRFILKYTEWFDGEADAFRFSKENFFMSEKDASHQPPRLKTSQFPRRVYYEFDFNQEKRR